LLKAFITWLNNEPKYRGIIDKDTCDGLMRELPAKNARDDCLQREQLELWFKSVKTINNPTIRFYLEILLLTGARRGELARLKWSDLDTQWHTATIRDKVEGTRKIPLTPYVELLLSQIPRVNQFVFASPTAKSTYISEPSIAHKQAIQSVGLPNMTIQGLRRSFGTLAEWVECPVGISAQIMGHKPSALAEKHYRVRPMELLRKWHTQIEKFILDSAGIIQPEENTKALRVINN
jgi:integrase